MDQITEQRVRERAYEMWVADGRPEGSHLRFWKEAEMSLAEDASKPDDEAPTDAAPEKG